MPVLVIPAIAPVGMNDPSNVIPCPLVNWTPFAVVAVPLVSINAVPLVHCTKRYFLLVFDANNVPLVVPAVRVPMVVVPYV